MRLTSFGAAEGVTGSKHLLELRGKRILLDCGLFQGHRRESDRRNRRLGFNADALHAVVLSHAHIDHSGLLPMLAKLGYRGAVFCTPATRDLCSIMLLDSAHIQERDAQWLSKKELEYVPPLYAAEDVHEIMKRFICVPYELPFQLFPDVQLTFHDAGHVLGSAMVELRYDAGDRDQTFFFSGDIGRRNMAILRDPYKPTKADTVLMESTYGDRDHDPIEQMQAKLADIVKRVYNRGGKIIVPSFALERTQEIIVALKHLEVAKAIPDIRVYVDSPLAVNVTEVFRLHTDVFDAQFRRLMEENGDPFELKSITYIRALEDSMQLNRLEGPAIIISASGMCEYGRVLHHLKNHCGDERNLILIVGFQAKNTLGRRIVERQRYLRILGLKYERLAEVKVMNEFSAHAGKAELLNFAERFLDAQPRFRLVHGEGPALESLRKGMVDLGFEDVRIQHEGHPEELDPSH